MMTPPLKLLSLPLFPLHTVLFPGGNLPLRVFEPRYRSMVQCCRAVEAPFGVVTLLTEATAPAASAVHPLFHHCGTLARIDSIHTMNSGMELLQCTGHSRFCITNPSYLPSGLWVADVEIIPDDKPVPIPSDLQHSANALRQVLHKLPKQQQEPLQDQRFTDCSWVANRWCELMPMPRYTQLRLLELNSPLLRLELITDALERAGIIS